MCGGVKELWGDDEVTWCGGVEEVRGGVGTSHVTRSITCMLRRSSCKPATACSSRSAVPPRALSQRTPEPLMPRPQVCCSPPPVSV